MVFSDFGPVDTGHEVPLQGTPRRPRVVWWLSSFECTSRKSPFCFTTFSRHITRHQPLSVYSLLFQQCSQVTHSGSVSSLLPMSGRLSVSNAGNLHICIKSPVTLPALFPTDIKAIAFFESDQVRQQVAETQEQSLKTDSLDVCCLQPLRDHNVYQGVISTGIELTG